MRGLRSTAVMLALFLALSGYAYFIESERPPASEADAPEEAFDVESNEIVSLTITADNGDVTEVSRETPDDDSWTVTAPFTAVADGNTVSAIVNSLTSLEIRRVVEDEAADLTLFGLTEPTFTVAFSTNEGTESLVVGDETPTGSDRYANVHGTTRVFLIASFLESTLNRASFDLRDRSLLEFTGPDVGGLVIEQNNAMIRFGKTEGEWRLVDPVGARADFGVVEGLVGRIGSAEMLAVEQESIDIAQEANLEPFGLDNPRMTVTVETGDEDHVLLIGDESPAGTVYGQDAARSIVFTMDAALFDDLARDAGSYRKKDLFDFRPFNATTVTVVRNENTHRFEKGSAAEDDSMNGDVWRRVEPDEGTVEQPAVDDLLSKLSGLRAESFIESRVGTGLDTPLAAVTVTFSDEQQEFVTIGRAGDTSHAVHGDEPGAAVVDSAAVDEALEALDTVSAPSADDTP